MFAANRDKVGLVMKSKRADTLANSLAAFCRYCQSIHVPRLFITLS